MGGATGRSAAARAGPELIERLRRPLRVTKRRSSCPCPARKGIYKAGAASARAFPAPSCFERTYFSRKTRTHQRRENEEVRRDHFAPIESEATLFDPRSVGRVDGRRPAGWGSSWQTPMLVYFASASLRTSETVGEVREPKQLGFHFRRQAPIGRYIVDFASFGSRVVIEIDGPAWFNGRCTNRSAAGCFSRLARFQGSSLLEFRR